VSTGRMTIKPMGFVFPLSTTIVCLIKHEQFHLDPKNQLVCFANWLNSCKTSGLIVHTSI
jgi:hypothetical protein